MCDGRYGTAIARPMAQQVWDPLILVAMWMSLESLVIVVQTLVTMLAWMSRSPWERDRSCRGLAASRMYSLDGLLSGDGLQVKGKGIGCGLKRDTCGFVRPFKVSVQAHLISAAP